MVSLTVLQSTFTHKWWPDLRKGKVSIQILASTYPQDGRLRRYKTNCYFTETAGPSFTEHAGGVQLGLRKNPFTFWSTARWQSKGKRSSLHRPSQRSQHAFMLQSSEILQLTLLHQWWIYNLSPFSSRFDTGCLLTLQREVRIFCYLLFNRIIIMRILCCYLIPMYDDTNGTLQLPNKFWLEQQISKESCTEFTADHSWSKYLTMSIYYISCQEAFGNICLVTSFWFCTWKETSSSDRGIVWWSMSD